MKEPQIDCDLVKEWAREAGEIALRYFNRVEGSFKADRTLVTSADQEIEDLLTGHLRATYPDHGRSWDELIGCVDTALYRAKNAGRNQIKSA